MLTGQCQVADDDADPLPVKLVDPAIPEGLVTGPQQQAEHRVKTGQEIGGDIQPRDDRRVAFVVYVATLFRIDFVSRADRRVIGGFRIQQPAPLRRLTRGVDVSGNRFPEMVEGR